MAPAARAQAPVPVQGTITKQGTQEPIVGATVEFYRTDIKGKYDTKTDKKGVYTYPLPQAGVYTIIISAPGYDPQYRTGFKIGASGSLDFALKTGSGMHPTLDDVARAPPDNFSRLFPQAGRGCRGSLWIGQSDLRRLRHLRHLRPRILP